MDPAVFYDHDQQVCPLNSVSPQPEDPAVFYDHDQRVCRLDPVPRPETPLPAPGAETLRIAGAVGDGGRNNPNDVRRIQQRLVLHGELEAGS